MHHCMWEKAHDELLVAIKEQNEKIAKLESDNMRLREDVKHYKEYGDLWMLLAKERNKGE